MKRYSVLILLSAIAVSLSLASFYLARQWEHTRAAHAFRGITADRVVVAAPAGG